MKKFAFVLAIVGVSLLAGCSLMTPPKPSDTVQRYVRSLNALDVDGMLDCIDPSVSKGVKAAMKVAGWLTGIPIKDIIDMLPLLKLCTGDIINMEILSMNEHVISETRAEVTAKVKQTVKDPSNGQTKTVTGTVVFPMVVVDGKWYIAAK